MVSHGGSAWESNPPNGLLTRYTGFEVRESHQCPIHFHGLQQKEAIILISVDLENNYLLYWFGLPNLQFADEARAFALLSSTFNKSPHLTCSAKD